jgi:HK97 gp10 family phage protein
VEVRLEFRGLDALEANLSRLETVARERVLRRAMIRAFRPVLHAARLAAPRRSGALRQSLAIVAGTALRNGGLAQRFAPTAVLGDKTLAASVAVVPRIKDSRAIALYNLDYGRTGNRRIRGIFYGHFLEFGTKRGVRPRRFLYNALRANAQTVIDRFAKEIGVEIKRTLSRK